jgi:predicted amidohydrolase
LIEKILEILKEVIVYQPDFVCLPEAFPFQNIEQKMTLAEKVEISEKAFDQLSGFSKQNNCYIICPVYTSEGGAIYNSAVVFDRKGKKIGVYNKIHPTEGEIEEGISPGAVFQPVIQTDFGPVGIQICFDINWADGWKMLTDQGVKIIFWPSAYGGGITVNTKAWQQRCIVASSTHKGTSRLCDISGEIVTQTGQWNQNLYCGPVNMEKEFLATWPYVNRFKDIQAKYGRKVRITNFHEEEWSIIESLSPDLFVKDILNEFKLKTYREHIGSAELLQNKARK